MARSVGIVECDCLADMVAAADRMVKAASVRLIRRENLGDARVSLAIEGDTAEVERALSSAKQNAPAGLTTTLVSNIDSRVLNVFDLPGGRFWS